MSNIRPCPERSLCCGNYVPLGHGHRPYDRNTRRDCGSAVASGHAAQSAPAGRRRPALAWPRPGPGPWPGPGTKTARQEQPPEPELPGSAATLSRHRLLAVPATALPAQRHQSPSPHAARVAGYRERRQDGAVTADHLVVFGSTGSYGLAKPGTTWWNTFSAYRGWESAWGLGNVTGSW